jgi:hypothetical protein
MKVFGWILVMASVLAACTASTSSADAGASSSSMTATTAGAQALQDSRRDLASQKTASTVDKAYAAYIAQYRSYPQQFWVSPNGSGAACSKSRPCSVATVTRKGGSGTVIWFLPGSYTFASEFAIYAFGTSALHAAYVSTIYGGANIVSTSNLGHGAAVWQTQGEYVDHVGFTLTGPGVCYGLESYRPQSFGNQRYAYLRVHDVATTAPACGSGIGGAGITTSGRYNLIENNVVWNIGNSGDGPPPSVHGIYVAGNDDVVRNNIVYNVPGGGCIQQWHGDDHGGGRVNIYLHNTLVKCVWGIVVSQRTGSVNGVYFANNILLNMLPSKLGQTYGVYECFAECGSVSGSNAYTNNITFNVGSNHMDGGTLANNISSDPHLLNPISPDFGGDFHLDSRSPAIQAGSTAKSGIFGSKTAAPTTDIDGTPRGDPPSIGAYE